MADTNSHSDKTASGTTGYVDVTPTNVDLHGGAHPCPNCGHCPTCGRSNQYWDWYWRHPVYPYPYTISYETSSSTQPKLTVLNGGAAPATSLGIKCDTATATMPNFSTTVAA